MIIRRGEREWRTERVEGRARVEGGESGGEACTTWPPMLSPNLSLNTSCLTVAPRNNTVVRYTNEVDATAAMTPYPSPTHADMHQHKLELVV